MSQAFSYKYIPILAVSPAEMSALDELPEKDKDLILPMFPLKGWASSRLLSKTLDKIHNVNGNRPWIADVDNDFLDNGENGLYPREVFYEVEDLLKSDNGYENWCNYIRDISLAIPTVQIHDDTDIESQIKRLNSLDRGIVFRFKLLDINSSRYIDILSKSSALITTNVLVIFDLGQITSNEVTFDSINKFSNVILTCKQVLPKAVIAISATSFPNSFSPYKRGENPIHERFLFNKLRSNNSDINLVYSDRGSARATKSSGGSGIPAPRIDYPLLNDWRFVRKEFEDQRNVSKDEKVILYSQASRDIVNSEFWDKDLKLWGTQLIELTALDDDFGINNPNKATAVRINIHLHTQLFYDSTRDDFIDTDEDWED